VDTFDPPEVTTVETDGGPIRHRTWDGPPAPTFVLLHGLGGSHLTWLQVAPSLAGLGRVVAPDLPGFGRTPLEGRSAAIMDLRRVVHAYARLATDGPLILVGNSMGGVIAVMEAAIAPERIRGMILTSSAYPWAGGGFPSPAVLAAFLAAGIPGVGEALVRARMSRLTAAQSVQLGLAMVSADPSVIPLELVRMLEEQVAEQQQRPDVQQAFLEASRSMLRLALRPDVAHRALDAVRCPTLVIHGRRDRLIPARFAEAELARHPAWRGRFLPDVGHVPQMEAPGRWVAEVADWHASAIGVGDGT
jgi:pimeloyl-ACP methyl ester carboxylesterase